MDVKTLKRKGGFVIKKQLIVEALKKPNIEGLAFALDKPGIAQNVNLQMFAVYREGNTFVSEPINFVGGKGAPSPMHHPATHVDHYEFRFLNKLQKDNFAFGFYSKNDFNLLFTGKNDFDEVYIGGAQLNFDYEFGGKKKWFALSLVLRKSIESMILTDEENSFTTTSSDKISLPKPNKKSVISINTLEDKIPTVFNDHRKVSSLIVNEYSNDVKGVTFSDSGDVPILFNGQYKVQSILLSQGQTIRKLIVKTETQSGNLDVEENNLGLYPNAVLTVPCPPHWPKEDGNALTSTLENTIADAVFECIMID